MPTAIRVIDQASEIVTDVTNFDNNLSSADTTVQAALETLDELSASASPGGSSGQVQFNNASAFGGAAGFTYQSGASPNVTIQAQNAAYVALLAKAAASQSTDIMQIQKSDGTVYGGFDSLGRVSSTLGVDSTNFFTAGAGNAAASGATNNVALGSSALATLSSGDYNFALGASALNLCTTGSRNTAIGFNAGNRINTSDNNICIGYEAGWGNSTGTGNIYLGYNAARQTGTYAGSDYNIVIGYEASKTIVAGADYNTSIGYQAGYKMSGSNNVFLGRSTGYNCTGTQNVFLGTYAGYRQTTNNKLLIIDMTLRASAAAEITDCIIYGVMDSSVISNQTLRVNASLIVSQDVGSGVASTNTYTGATDTPTTDPGWATSSSVDMNAPDGYIKAYVGTQAVVIPYWNT